MPRKKSILLLISSLAAVAVIAAAAYLVPKYGFIGSFYAIQDKLANLEIPINLSNFLIPLTAVPSQTAHSSTPFTYIEIDSTIAGDCKMVGDIDGDGFPDLIIGGMPNEKLNWYRYPNWEKTVIATPVTEFTTDCALADVDGDGDLDIIVPDGDSGNNLVWFANPRPNGDVSDGAQWVRHEIGPINGWGKDVKPADYDGDGRLDVATRNDHEAIIFFQTSANSWSRMVFTDVNTGKEGMAAGDINLDGHQDLVLQGVWLRNPGGSQARTPASWSQYTIGPANEEFKALVVDLNQDGTMDVLFSSSENTADVDWWTPSSGDPTGTWIKHTIYSSLEKAHTLQVADLDLDGDLDVVLGQMHTAAQAEIFIMLNVNGEATSWEKQLVGQGGLHNGVVADIDMDGDYDIYGANWTGNPPVKLWQNRSENFGIWKYKQVTSSHQQTFGLAFGDVDRDGQNDIISGQNWYRNPGGDMTGDWAASSLPGGMHAALFLDVDGDSLSDVIAQKDEGDIAVYWLEAADPAGKNWNQVKIGSLPRASHPIGAQGYKTAQIEAEGKEEILFSSGNGIYYFEIPANPAAGNWPMIHVSSNPSDEGFGVADIDGDGKLDIAATSGDSKKVEWYRNPGDGSANWPVYHIGNFNEAVYPDRTEAADLNGDGKPDIIVTEENGLDNEAKTFWWEQPADPTSGNWNRHLIVTQGTTNSLDIGDVNGDGSIDLTLAEHRGDKRLTLWLNNGQGVFEPFTISSGHESHLGARLFDLNNDENLDIVSIAWDDSSKIHLWINRQGATAADDRSYIPLVTNSPAPQTQQEAIEPSPETVEPELQGQRQDENADELAISENLITPGEAPINVTGISDQKAADETVLDTNRLVMITLIGVLVVLGLALFMLKRSRLFRNKR